jgi:peptidoglycan/xylan/chitin deacetylase (PgdA/CDA1 family)
MNKIINLHSVNDVLWFEKVILFLKSRYKMVPIQPIDDYISGNTELNNLCHITVDDGDLSFYKNIYPVLKKLNVPASIYVSPKVCIEKSNYWFQEIEGYNKNELIKIIADMTGVQFNLLIKYNIFSILKTRTIYQINEIIKRYNKITNTSGIVFQNMTVDNLKEVDRSGLVTIGAHTINHPILRNEDDATSKFEICESINELSTLLNHEIKFFAFPNGIPELDFSEREKSYLRESSIQLAFATLSKSLTSYEDAMSLPRFAISNSESLFYLRAKLFLDYHWETIARMRSIGEYKERTELVRFFLEKRSSI